MIFHLCNKQLFKLLFFFISCAPKKIDKQIHKQNDITMQRFILMIAILMASYNFTHAGGYEVSLHGQRQLGMGLIGTSLAFDASAAFNNPGALAMMPAQLSIVGGVNGIFASTAFRMEQPSMYEATTDNPLSTPFHFYAAGMLTDRLAAGIAVNTPYGNSLEWGEEWAGRFLIQEISLMAITIQPTLSYRLTDMLSVGAGFVYAYGAVDLKRALPVEGPDGEGQLHIEGNTGNFGFNAGVQFAHPLGWSAGLSYRSKIDMDVENGDALFLNIPSSLAAEFPAINQVDVSLPLPANLDFGLSYQLTPDLLLGMALHYVFWSDYDELVFDFEENTGSLPDSYNTRDYSNTLIFRAGGEYRVNPNIYLRAGGYYDPTPVNSEYFSPETPSLDNLAFTGGVSFVPNRNLSIDGSVLYILGLEADMQYTPENFGGTYSSRIFIPGIGITYQF